MAARARFGAVFWGLALALDIASCSTPSTDDGTASVASCKVGQMAALAESGEDTPDGQGTAETALLFTNVGGSGRYSRVTNMNPGVAGQSCPFDACQRAITPSMGALAPFNEELTLSLRGPLELYDLAFYAPDDSGGYARVSYWNRCAVDNLVFLNNQGGGLSGIETACGGKSQSYAASDGKQAAAEPTAFSGSLDNEVEVNALTSKPCVGADDSSECGFSRGVALRGFATGGGGLFAIRARMPRYSGAPGTMHTDEPALRLLNARIVRTAQYGCSCYGVGSSGGCGELSLAEVLPGAYRGHATTTFYSFQGVHGADDGNGDGHYLLRPENKSAIFIVLLDAGQGGAARGSVRLTRLAADGFDFGASIPVAAVAAFTATAAYSVALP
jgi:hypothetical protein